MKNYFVYCLFFLLPFKPKAQFDICVYGGTSGGVMAAYAAASMGKTVLLIDAGNHLGGLSSGGLGYTDIGNKYAITGLAKDFYRNVGKHYGKLEQWTFEPHVAEKIFNTYAKHRLITIWYQYRIISATKNNGRIQSVELEFTGSKKGLRNRKVIAKMFIDCSYEGDLMAKAGVSYFTGREDNRLFNETYNGVQLMDKHQFPDGIDPYKKPGDSSSGLLWGVSNLTLQPRGVGDKKIQAYNFRICLTNQPANRIAITKPNNYEADRYELLLRYLEKKPAKDLWTFLKFDLMPNHKTDINNNGPFSTDMIGMNYDYPEAGYSQRKAIQQSHEEYVKGFLYFIGHDSRMPAHLRNLMLQWGYPKDEYTGNGNWSPQMYVREARRLNGAYVMTQANCQGKVVVMDGIGMAAYTMDSHNCQRLVVNGMVKNEGDVQVGGFGPYPVAYRAIVPKSNECGNLLVPVCLSATHIAYGSIRMEPVFMVLGHSAAVAASMAIDQQKNIQDIDVGQLQGLLKSNPTSDNRVGDILCDNADTSAIHISGQWQVITSKCYGANAFTISQPANNARVEFLLTVPVAGKYRLYSYYNINAAAAPETSIAIKTKQGTTNTSIVHKAVVVEGQTSGEWLPLGMFDLEAGEQVTVAIIAAGSQGIVTADAVQLVKETKD
ncbi:MAG: FAD-dependent oxidoreductase [Ferruginibacter sp.]|nr:FAD-dependent oxidoreductase [Ferruginibacter sp.]